jgi:DNA-binding NarL/FixJ family response regulator
MPREHTPILIALVDDYDVVLTGIASMLDPYRDRVLVAEIDANEPLDDTVDIALYDSFAQPESDHDQIEVLLRSPHAKRVAVYTWNFDPRLIEGARQRGAHGWSSSRPSRPSIAVRRSSATRRPGLARHRDWTGRAAG